MTELLVLVHTPGAGPSAFVDVLDGRTTIAPWRAVDVPAGEPLPGGTDGLAGVLVMGGRMSAVDPQQHPWMAGELALLRAAVDDGVPVFGVCLGAQLLAQALGGEVVARETPMIGFHPLTRTPVGEGDEVTAGWPDGAPGLFVHEDEVTTLPPDAVALLTGTDGVSVWRDGSAHAVQFHPELTAEQLEAWVESGLVGDLFARAGVDGAALIEEARRRDRYTVAIGRALVGRWIDAVVRVRLAERSA